MTNMSAIDAIEKIMSTSIAFAGLKFCLVDINKLPFRTDNKPAKSNVMDDFVDIDKLLDCTKLNQYAGVGISIQASNICAIDVDKCFKIRNDITSADERAKEILELFKDDAYCEFSFSGTGLRVLFKHDVIDNYSQHWYIKNSKYDIEFYQPSKSYRYVTLTGNVIYDKFNENANIDDKLKYILDTYMKKQITVYSCNTVSNETRSYDELMTITRIHRFQNAKFRDCWCFNAPGSGKDESERDFFLMSYLFENITQDKSMIQQLFESSDFFKTKDNKHIWKWTSNNYRYFNYLYDLISKRHGGQ